MNYSKNKANRLALLALITTMPIAAGCNSSGLSMASMNPFSKGDAAASATPPQAVAANEPGGVQGQLASFGKSTKNVFSKATNVFNRDKTNDNAAKPTDDALSLNNMPEKVDPSVHVANGQLWESTGDPKKAAESYQRAIAADPSFGPALANLARLNYRQGDYPGAAQSFQAALKQSPNDAQLYNELGLTLNKLGRTDMAITVMQRALTLAPGTSRYANSLATVMHESGNPQGAYEVLVKNNKPAVAHFNMAYLQFKSGNIADSEKHLNETMKFQAAAGQDPAVARAIDRSKGMLGQIAALNKGKRNTGKPIAGTVASKTAPPTKPAATQPTTAKTTATRTTNSSTSPAARVAAHTSPAKASATNVPFGFGWPTNDTADGTTVKKASVKMPAITVPSSAATTTTAPNSDVTPSLSATTKATGTDTAAKTPSWLDAFEQSKASPETVAPPKKLSR